MKLRLTVTYSALMCFVLGACGGGGGGGSSAPITPTTPVTSPMPPVGSVDIEPPTAEIVFPQAASLAQGSSLTVTGRASDESGVRSVQVNGIEASTNDSYMTWRVSVPLSDGMNSLTVRTEDAEGNIDSDASSREIDNGPFFTSLIDLATDRNSNVAYVIDQDPRAVYSVDLDTGARRLVSGAGIAIDGVRNQFMFGDGPAFNGPVALAIDAANDRLLVVDSGSLMAVDIGTGERSTFTGDEVGSGPSAFPRDVAIDAESNRAIVTADGVGLVAIDLTTRDRAIISGSGVGSGVEFGAPISLTLVDDKAIVLDQLLRAWVEVDLGTGDRTIAFDFSQDAPPRPDPVPLQQLDLASTFVAFDEPLDAPVLFDIVSGERAVVDALDRDLSGSEIDVVNGRLLHLDADRVAVEATDISSGEVTPISASTVAEGPAFEEPYTLAIDSSRNQLLVGDVDIGGIIAVDLETGNRSLLAADTQGIGPRLLFPSGLTVNPSSGEIYVGENGGNFILQIDPTSGDRSTVFDVSLDPDIAPPVYLESDAQASSILVSNQTDIFELDATLLELESVSGSSKGSGPELNELLAIAADDDAQVIYGVDFRSTDGPSVIRIDRSTGDREIIASSAVGTGVELLAPIGIDILNGRDQLVVTDTFLLSIVAVNLDGSERVELSGPSIGNGHNFRFVRGIAYDAESDILYAADSVGIYAIEPDSGDRVLISH